MTTVRPARALPGLLAVAASLACHDSNPIAPGPSLPGFTAQVTGGADHRLAGPAVFVPEAIADGLGFAMALTQPVPPGSGGDPRYAIYLFRNAAGLPPAGRYAIADSPADFQAAVLLDGASDNPVLCAGLSGSILITAGPAGRVRGTFSLSAGCLRTTAPGTDDPIEVAGSFDATPQDPAAPPLDLPLLERRVLVGAAGSPLPALVAEGQVDGDSFQVLAVGGFFRLGPGGRYQHGVELHTLSHGVLIGRTQHNDRGLCLPDPARLRCASEYLQNLTFQAVRNGGGIEITQDLAGEGVAATYRFE